LRHCLFSAALLPLVAAVTGAQTMASGSGISAKAGFGGAVEIVGSDVLVGEPNNQMRSGLVYVYRRGQNGWAERATIAANDKFDGDGFGASIDVDGSNTMIVGALRQNDGKGAAYIFSRNNGSGAWTQTAKLAADSNAAGDAFGTAVAISGDHAFVSAPGQTEQSGAVYVFRRQGTSWSQVTKLTGSAVRQSLFGMSLAADGQTAFVGMPGFNERTGQVLVFRNVNGTWTESAKLSTAGAVRNDRFGVSLALRGNELLVGSTGANASGAVVVFTRDGEEWRERGRLTAFDGGRTDGFGGAVALTPDAVWVGAPRARASRGAVYMFDRSAEGGEVAMARKFGSGAADAPQDALGNQIAASPTLVAATIANDDYQSGSVVLYEKNRAGSWTEATVLKSPSERIASITGREVKCQADSTAAVFDCGNVDLLSFVSVADLGGARGVQLNDVWGWTDPQTNREYALVGRLDGTSFVDVTDPSNPKYLGNLPKPDSANANVWRDIKVYQNHAYVVADGSGPHGMQVFDLTRLRNVRNAPQTFTMDAHYRNINSAHNIVINEETGFAYSVGSSSGGETCGGGLHMIDIREPKNPKFAGCFADPQTGRSSTGYSHDAQCVTYTGPDSTYRGREICMGSNETALSIADVTDKANPKALSRASYPNVGYSHQGWLTPDQQYFYMNDELDEIQGSTPRTRTIIWDVTDLDDPQLVGEFLGNTEASDHNLYIKDKLMYQSHYQAGLRIVDISDPKNPVEIGFFDTVPYGKNRPGFGGSWSNYPFFKSGTIIVTSGNEGLFILKKREGEPIS
jgi:choice-of-anchor B domain-containing protein